MLRPHVVCATGHRPDKLFGYDIHTEQYHGIRIFFRDQVKKLLDEHDEIIAINGGALGVDQIFAETMCAMRDKGFPVKVWLFRPAPDWNRIWPEESRHQWAELIKQMDMVRDISFKIDKHAFAKRNMSMVDESRTVLGVYIGGNGGTQHCLEYAWKKNRHTIILNPFTSRISDNEGVLRCKMLFS